MYSEAAERPEFGDRRQVVTAGEYHEPRVAAGRAARPLGRFEPREVRVEQERPSAMAGHHFVDRIGEQEAAVER